MMYGLSQDVTYCEVGGHMIFLDIAKDQYFRLESTLERSLRDHLYKGSPLSNNLRPLVATDVLIEKISTVLASPSSIGSPLRSAVECPQSTGKHRQNSSFIEVMWTIARMKRRLKIHDLKSILADEVAYRRAHSKAHMDLPRLLEELTIQASSQFLMARRYVPIEPRCLLDSLSLLHFLSRHGFPARIIFGVTLEPFSAHCWVQAGDIALNENLSIANAHTPIRAV